MRQAATRRDGSVAESLREYARGLGGGFLFSMPLLFTMEIWSASVTVPPLRLLAALAGTFILLCGYNAYAGLRHDTGATEIAIDSVEELGLGLLTSAAFLALLGRIGADMALSDSQRDLSPFAAQRLPFSPAVFMGLVGGCFDIAVRDAVLSIGAFGLARQLESVAGSEAARHDRDAPALDNRTAPRRT